MDIVGVYTAPAAADATSGGNLAAALAAAVGERTNGKPLALVAVGTKLLSSEHGLVGADSVAGYSETLAKSIRADIAAGRFAADWDDHLADPRVDWWP